MAAFLLAEVTVDIHCRHCTAFISSMPVRVLTSTRGVVACSCGGRPGEAGCAPLLHLLSDPGIGEGETLL